MHLRSSLSYLRMLFAALFLAANVVPAAAERSFGASYVVSLYGLTIGKADFVGTIGAMQYRIDGHLSSAGVAEVFSRMQGEISAHGRITGQRIRPTSFLLDYLYDDKRRRTRIAFADNQVSETTLTPAPTGRRDSWIEVADRHLVNVLDPISATILLADSPKAVCEQVLKLYDGELRANLVLSPVGTTDKGAVVCKVRFLPIAGYHRDNKSMIYARDKSRITFTYSPLGDGAYGLAAASIGTQIGTFRLSLRRLDLR